MTRMDAGRRASVNGLDMYCEVRSDDRPLVLVRVAAPEDPRQPERPLHLSLAGGGLFCFAGLWTCWTSPDGQVVASCTIITCEANEPVRPIHERMPVVFADPGLRRAWLHPSLDSGAAREVLTALPAEGMVVRPASPVVNTSRHAGPECLTLPVAA
jgi:putative SOS response-associated peptidase YedK